MNLLDCFTQANFMTDVSPRQPDPDATWLVTHTHHGLEPGMRPIRINVLLLARHRANSTKILPMTTPHIMNGTGVSSTFMSIEAFQQTFESQY
jgi:hypothetical protein